MPKVSIMFPSFNHAQYVHEALSSILKQTFQDFEVIASDDCSTDGTADVIRSFTDDRIQFHRFEEHAGPTKNHRYCWEHCTGEYIALLNSDDVWLPDHLEKAVSYLDKHPSCGVVFSWCSEIDENGNTIAPISDEFRCANHSRAQWLRFFFTHGNCLCHPSMVIRREVYEQLGFYSETLRQLPDFDLWIRVVKHFDIHIIQEPLVQFRRCSRSMSNTSAPVLINSIRDIAESQYILSHFFDALDDKLFAEAFRPLFVNPEAKSREELLCEKYFLLRNDMYYIPKISLHVAFPVFHEIAKVPGVLETMKTVYDYSLDDFFEFSGQLDITGISQLSDESDLINVLAENPNSPRNRLKALAWAVFGKNTKAYCFFKKITEKCKFLPII